MAAKDDGSQRSKAAVTKADVAAERRNTRGGAGRAWRRVRAWLENQKLLAVRGGTCKAGSSRFWWQWTDLDEIYPMELCLS